MKISFVVPAYNEEALLTRSLTAIRDEILRNGQVIGQDAEIIVVNNASTDRTRDVAEAIEGVVVVDEPRKGLVQARWCGFEASSGELIANIDADTVIPQGWLTEVLRQFNRNETLVGLSGPYIYYGVPHRVNMVVGAYYPAGLLGVFFQPLRAECRLHAARRQFCRKTRCHAETGAAQPALQLLRRGHGHGAAPEQSRRRQIHFPAAGRILRPPAGRRRRLHHRHALHDEFFLGDLPQKAVYRSLAGYKRVRKNFFF